jgi:glycosyltransferase involved in cell wall biosynthesis
LRVAVIIPAKNEEANIERCLISIQRDAGNSAFASVSIFVIDNGSTDSTPHIATRGGAMVVSRPGISIGAVRNQALDLDPDADVYAFIDADCEATDGWLSAGIRLLNAPSVGAVGGYLRLPSEANWVQAGWALPRKEVTKAVEALPTGSLFVDGRLFRRLGGFNSEVVAGEDTELSRRIVKSGLSLLLSPAVSVIHHGYPATIRDFLVRQFWQSSDYLQTLKSRADITFFGVNAFLLFLLLVIIGALTSEVMWIYLGLAGSVLIALALAGYRYLTSACDRSIGLFCKVVVINYLYLLGRAAGLVRSYWRTMKRN